MRFEARSAVGYADEWVSFMGVKGFFLFCACVYFVNFLSNLRFPPKLPDISTWSDFSPFGFVLLSSFNEFVFILISILITLPVRRSRYIIYYQMGIFVSIVMLNQIYVFAAHNVTQVTYFGTYAISGRLTIVGYTLILVDALKFVLTFLLARAIIQRLRALGHKATT